ncbi:MAG: hypothetical protein O7G88_02310 [bacterium]|nr:hypothetical protein [bacterium]
MNPSALIHWRRTLLWLGTLLLLSGVLLYGLEQTRQAYATRLQQADAAYQNQHYPDAIIAYQSALEQAQRPAIQIGARLLGHLVSPAHLTLQIANCRYRIAEAELRHYQQASRDPRVTPRPSLVKVQRLLTEAGQAYDDIAPTEPRIYQAAQVNGARAQTWQLILAAVDEQTSGRRTLRQLAAQAIRQTAAAVDYSHAQQAQISRQARMSAMLLLELLTTFSQKRPAPLPPRALNRHMQQPLGDLLLQDRPELSKRERQRFQQFFFALPIEAKNPWPASRQGGAGGGQQPAVH